MKGSIHATDKPTTIGPKRIRMQSNRDRRAGFHMVEFRYIQASAKSSALGDVLCVGTSADLKATGHVSAPKPLFKATAQVGFKQTGGRWLPRLESLREM